jgi:ribosomal protein L18E
MDDPYLNELKDDFDTHSNQLKKLKIKLLKTNSTEQQSEIIKQIDSIANKMENNQRQSAKVTKSRIKERKSKSKRHN